jgi:hypothetical protein
MDKPSRTGLRDRVGHQLIKSPSNKREAQTAV